jgi:hypothetical protein
MMDLIYAGADQVLVLDGEFQQVDGGKSEVLVFAEGYSHPPLRCRTATAEERFTLTWNALLDGVLITRGR